jgi:hypothetical protein
MSTVLVSAANARFFPLLRDLLESIADHEASRGVSLGILDVGLEPEQRAWVEERATVVEPGWDLDLGKQAGAPPHERALTARPFLPRHFPGHEVYVWLDADTWVQDWSSLDLLVRGAREGALAIVPEIDRSYGIPATEMQIDRVLGIPYRVTSYTLKRFADIYGKEAAKAMFDRTVLNAGVYALAADAPHWEVWAEEYQKALHRTRRRGADQIALNYAAYQRGLALQRLPALCNWVVHKAIPALDPATGKLVEPNLPHTPVGILHLTMGTKEREWDVAVLGGGTERRTLRYRGRSDSGSS